MFTLPAWAQTIVASPAASFVTERRLETVGTHPALLVGRHPDHLIRSEPEQPQRAEHRDVHFGADDHAHPRSVLETVRFDVPAGAPQQLVARGCQGGEIGHVAAGDEPDAGVSGKTEEVEQPSRRDFFHDGRRRRHHEQRRRLIPRGRQPFGGHRRRQGAAGDEPEISRSGCGDQAGLSGTSEGIDHLGGIDGSGGQRDSERGAQLLKRCRWPDQTGGAGCRVRARDFYRAGESVLFSHVTIACVTAGLTCLSVSDAYSTTSPEDAGTSR